MKPKYIIKIEIKGEKAKIFLLDRKTNILDSASWKSHRNLSEKILEKISNVFFRNRISLKDILKFDFDCDSPYFEKKKREKDEFSNESKNSKGRCGFTSWQIGEITAKTLNFMISK